MPVWTQKINSGGSGSGTVTIIGVSTGTVDGNNTQFGFSVEPSIIVSDGSSLVVNHGWTWNSGTLTATLQIPPTYYIFGIE